MRLGVECNILERPSIDAAIAATVEHYGRIDGLINNAHTFTAKVAIAEVGEEDLDLNHGTVKGTLWAMQAARPHMKAQGWGRIVNFVSAAGHHRHGRLRRVQRVEGSDPRAHPHRRASGDATASS